MLDDLAVAFAMRCDEQGLTYEAGQRAAQTLADEIYGVADDRDHAPREEDEDG